MEKDFSRIFESGSFRDRQGRVLYWRGEVFRALSETALQHWKALTSKSFFTRYTDRGNLIATELHEPAQDFPLLREGWAGFLRHERIPFISYPYEWSFGMLKDAALLQLDLLEEGLKEEMILKDSSGFNFQWKGSLPVFIDIPSFEALAPGEPWVGYRQFCQMFLFPLFLQAYKDIPFHPWFRGRIEGFLPEHCNHLMSIRDLFRPGVFTHVFLQSKAQVRYGNTSESVKREMRTLGFNKKMILNNVRGLKRIVENLHWKKSKSQWSEYAEKNCYNRPDQTKKIEFVKKVVGSQRLDLVWDLGCNTGVFSRIVSENASYVVAMDSDHLSVERFYQSLKQTGCRNILPLVMDFSDPSPNLGWKGLERKGLTERGAPDLILCLALIHHLVIGANIPLREVIEFFSTLGEGLVIEFVTKQDPMVQVLLKNKEDIYTDYSIDHFEACLKDYFKILQRGALTSGTRTIYFAKRKGK